MSSLSKLKSWAASVWYIFVVADMYWARFSRDPEHVAEDLLELGKLNLDRRRWDAAGMYYSRAQTIARKDGHGAIAARAALGLMYVWIGRKDYARAVQELEPELSQIRRLRDKQLVAGALRWFGISNERIGRVEAASDLYRESLALATSIGDPAQRGWALGNLGGTAYISRNYKQAHAYWVEALRTFRSRKDSEGIALMTYWLGLISANDRRFDEARRLFDESAKTY